jgi:predicted SnoaL-like aldol condensation-catalyzing enzyme
MEPALEKKNKAIVLEAFGTLFNRRDYAAAEKFWSPDYIQHSAHIEPGREGLFKLVKNSPATLKYEPGLVVADGDYVILHRRFSGMGQSVNWILADILRIENGLLAEHWNVIQNEASRETSKSDLPMSLIALPKAARIWPKPPAVAPFRWWAFGNKFSE